MGASPTPALLRAIPPQPRQHPLHRLGGLLARWHCWRRAYSPERGYARSGGPVDPEDELEQLLMSSIEVQVSRLPIELQRAVAQVARAECLGVECPLPGQPRLAGTHTLAVELIAAGLTAAGLL